MTTHPTDRAGLENGLLLLTIEAAHVAPHVCRDDDRARKRHGGGSCRGSGTNSGAVPSGPTLLAPAGEPPQIGPGQPVVRAPGQPTRTAAPPEERAWTEPVADLAGPTGQARGARAPDYTAGPLASAG